MFNCWTDTLCLQQFGVMNIFRSPETCNIRAWWTVLRFRYFSENYMYSYVVIKDTETWGGSLLRLIMDTMTIWIIPMGKHSKYLLRKSLQRILGRFRISFQEGAFLYVEGEGILLEEDTRDGHVSPSGNGCTYRWLGYVQQFDLQKVFVFWYGSYVSPKNQIWNLKTPTVGKGETWTQTTNFIQFLGCKAQLLVFFSSIEPNWGTSFAQLHCSQGAGEILGVSPEGGWDDYFPKAIVGLVQCHEAYELQIGSLVEKVYPSNSFSKGVLLGRCLAEQTGQLSPTILLWALLRSAAAVDQDPAMSLRTLPARFAPMQSAAQAEWLSLDYSVELTGQTHSLP